MDKDKLNILIRFQKYELTEHIIYKMLAEMLIISGGVSIISFIIGIVVRKYFGIEV